MTQLEEADMFIKTFTETKTLEESMDDLRHSAKEYIDKYHPTPKTLEDKFFEKWMTLTEISASERLNIKAEYDKAKELGLFIYPLEKLRDFYKKFDSYAGLNVQAVITRIEMYIQQYGGK